MNTLLNKWLAILRGNNFQQGRGALRSRDDEFCCLGLLSEAACIPAEKREHESYVSPGTMVHEGWAYDGDMSYVPTTLLEEVGLDFDDGRTLADFNDEEKLTFPQIADEIERMLALKTAD